MRPIAMALAVTLMLAGVADAVPTLTYESVTSGTDTLVTASDGATVYWKMQIETDAAQNGSIEAFYDYSGASASDFNYGYRYNNKMGLFDPIDEGFSHTWTISNIVQGTSAMTYTLSRDLTSGAGTATYSMDWTINAPVVAGAGYTTNITSENTWAYDANWVGVNGQARTMPRMSLWASDPNGVGDEYDGVAVGNGSFAADNGYQKATATVTGTDSDMAAGSTFEMTNTWVVANGYNNSSCFTEYDGTATYGRFVGELGIGVTSLNGNPGVAGSARSFTSTTELDITIVPEPATMGLLGLGLFGLVARRKK